MSMMTSPLAAPPATGPLHGRVRVASDKSTVSLPDILKNLCGKLEIGGNETVFVVFLNLSFGEHWSLRVAHIDPAHRHSDNFCARRLYSGGVLFKVFIFASPNNKPR